MSNTRLATIIVCALIYLGGWFGAATDVYAGMPVDGSRVGRVTVSLLLGAAWPALYTASVVGNQLMPREHP